jgi:hypothetical protein
VGVGVVCCVCVVVCGGVCVGEVCVRRQERSEGEWRDEWE